MEGDCGKIEIEDLHFSGNSESREPMQAKTQATDVEVIAYIIASFALEQKHQTADLE